MAVGMAGMGLVAGMAAPSPLVAGTAAHFTDSPEGSEAQRLLRAGRDEDSADVREGARALDPICERNLKP